jgi:hypothetical protein
VLSRKKVLESVVIADTYGGDEFIFHPDQPDAIYVLERGGDHIYKAGSSLPEALEWFCTSGKLTRKTDEHSFRPYTASTTDVYVRPPGDGPFPDDLSERIKALGIHDRVRREVEDPTARHPQVRTTFVVKAIGGEVVCEEGDYGEVLLQYEEGCRAKPLKLLLALLQEAGLRKRSELAESPDDAGDEGDCEELLDPTDQEVAELEGREDIAALELTFAGSVTDQALAVLAKLPYLTRLSLHGAEQITDRGVKRLARCKRLRYLSLESPNVTDAGIAALSSLKHLETLAVRPPFPRRLSKVKGSCLARLSKLRKLKALHFMRAEVRNDALRPVAKMKQLEALSLPGARLTAKCVSHLLPLVNLRHLMLPDKLRERVKTELQAKNPRLCIDFSDDSMTW